MVDLHGVAAEVRAQGQLRIADDGGAVGEEAEGAEVGRGGAQVPVGDDEAERVAGGHDEVIAVDAAEDALTAALKGLGHGVDGLLVEDVRAVADLGRDAGGGGIGDVVLLAQVGLRGAPHDLAGERGPVADVQGIGIDPAAEGVGRQGGRDEEGRSQDQSGRAAEDGSHSGSFPGGG